METLRSVYIFHIKIPTQPLTRFFAQLRTLNELDMDYDNDSTVNKLPDGTWPISEHLQHLASIRINMGPNWLDEGCISGLGSFFESLSTRCLQYVTLEIRFSHLRGEKQNQDIGEWVNIDKALSRKMFQSIQKVRVEWTGKIHGKVDGLEVCRQIEAKFPALQKCGCLEVRVLSFDEWAPGFGDRAK
ncbi:uncharacterized protein FIBRA_07095 [Fibroporia radiculosa]|uniref:Uncharacterized protein n=1 Tax=Fibroporia radiculosa TaxID=599839 RepID=J4H4F4_9APHY|nr:uncharacterized protein FIBRA_07095 [Fibroporia radiculosa]CCM04899.1 predicted protein [Fibroporia radiculosa]